MRVNPGPLTGASLVQIWHPDLTSAAVIVLVAAAYAWCYRRRRSSERSVRPAEAGCFGVGVVLWVLATISAIGAGVVWILGDVVGWPFVLLLMRALSRDERAHAVQVDAELDASEAAESESAAPSGLWWENDPQLRERFRRG